jgi:hypothetical protein
MLLGNHHTLLEMPFPVRNHPPWASLGESTQRDTFGFAPSQGES